MSYKKLVLNKDLAGLTHEFWVNPDSCDNPDHYNHYIRFVALTDQAYGMGTTHILLDEKQNKIAGYVALKANALLKVDEDGGRRGYPAIEITELAVDGSYERQGVGENLLRLVFKTAWQTNRELMGVQYIILLADPQSTAFYEKMGFGVMPYDAVPNEGWNKNCIPMMLKIIE